MAKQLNTNLIYNPGVFGTFFFWLAQVYILIVVLFFLLLTGGCSALVIWSIATQKSSERNFFENSSGNLDWSIIIGSIACFVVFPFLIKGLIKLIRDIISPLTVEDIIIEEKTSAHVAGSNGGYRAYYIQTKTKTFEISKKSYDQLSIRQRLRISYTPAQEEVRKIVIIK